MRRILLFLCLLAPSMVSWAQRPDGERELVCDLKKVDATPKGRTGKLNERVTVTIQRISNKLTVSGRGIGIVFSIGALPNAKTYEDNNKWSILEGTADGDRKATHQLLIGKLAGRDQDNKSLDTPFFYNSVEGSKCGPLRCETFAQRQITGTCDLSFCPNKSARLGRGGDCPL
jgi:hypothetical protein